MPKGKKSEHAPQNGASETGLMIDIDLDQVGPMVELPRLAALPEKVYIPTHVETRLDLDQGRTLRRLYDTLDQGGLRLKNGRRIASNADVIRWLLEAIAGANAPSELEESDESGVGSIGT